MLYKLQDTIYTTMMVTGRLKVQIKALSLDQNKMVKIVNGFRKLRKAVKIKYEGVADLRRV